MDNVDLTTVSQSLLLALLPDEYRPLAEAITSLLYQMGLALAALRVVLNYLPQGRTRWWVELFDKWLDRAAANSKPLSVRPPPKGRKSVPPYLSLFWALPLAALVSCAGTREERVRSSIDAAMSLASPALQLALEHCALPGVSPDACAKVHDAMERLAIVLQAARTALANGYVDQALDLVAQTRSIVDAVRSSGSSSTAL
jgi:hypothetical protein